MIKTLIDSNKSTTLFLFLLLINILQLNKNRVLKFERRVLKILANQFKIYYWQWD